MNFKHNIACIYIIILCVNNIEGLGVYKPLIIFSSFL